MENTSNNFEQQLSEILDSGHDFHENSHEQTLEKSEKKEDHELVPPRQIITVGIIIRIISFIAVIILLISFGMQIAFR